MAAKQVAPAVPVPAWETPPADEAEADFRRFVLTPAFQNCQTFFEQIGHIHEALPHISSYKIAKLLRVRQSRVDFQMRNISRGPRANGRPSHITQEIIDRIDEMVKAAAKDKTPLRLTDISHFLHSELNIDIALDTLRKALKRTKMWQFIKVSPIEHERHFVDEEQIADYKRRLKATLDQQPATFVFNCDESGFDSWCDAREVTCILPLGVDWNKMNYPVRRNEKRVTLLGCVSAAGEALPPLVIASRKTIDADVLQAGYTPDKVAYHYSCTGYITEEIFRNWLLRVFVPHIAHIRAASGRFSQLAFLIMDNCSCHESDEIDTIMHSNGIQVIPLIPHSSHLTQQLDIGIFGNVKLAQSRIHPGKECSVQSRQLLKMLGHGFKSPIPVQLPPPLLVVASEAYGTVLSS